MLYDVVIVGGSFAGLSAAMSLGRTLLKVACIDGGEPCNRFADRAHNSIAYEDRNPVKALAESRKNVEKYSTIKTFLDLVVKITRQNDLFDVATKQNGLMQARRLIFATGVKDKLEETSIENFSSFWGTSVVHCPYCHGYEMKDKPIGLCSQDPMHIAEMAKIIYGLNKEMVVLTNGKPVELEIANELQMLNIKVVENPIRRLEGHDGHLEKVVFSDGSESCLEGLYMIPPAELNGSEILSSLGVKLENNLIKIDQMGKTNIPGVYACGDCTTPMRSITTALFQGMIAGVICSKEILAANFEAAASSK